VGQHRQFSRAVGTLAQVLGDGQFFIASELTSLIGDQLV